MGKGCNVDGLIFWSHESPSNISQKYHNQRKEPRLGRMQDTSWGQKRIHGGFNWSLDLIFYSLQKTNKLHSPMKFANAFFWHISQLLM